MLKAVCNIVPRIFQPTSLRAQSKRIHEGNWVSVDVGEAVESDGVGDLAGDNICVDESAHFRRVVPRSHIDETVIIGHNTVSAIVAKDNRTVTAMLDRLSIGIVCKGIGDVATRIGDSNGTASTVEIVDLEGAASCLTNQAVAIDIFGGDTVGRLAEQLTELGLDRLPTASYSYWTRAPSANRLDSTRPALS